MAKYKAYPEYKDSGVEWLGEIPIHWEMLRHKYVAFFTKGKNPTNLLEQPLKNTLPYLSMECLRNNTTDKYALISNDVRIALEGQPLIIWDGSNAGEFVKGKSGILSSTMAAATLTYPLHPQYYWYVCISIEPEMRKNAVGMGIPHVNGDELKSISFGIPSFCEQKQIAVFLDHETAKIDNLIEKQQQLIELLKEKRQAVISHAVTKGLNPDVPMKDSGVEWLGDVPEHWGVTRAKFISKIFVPQRNKPELNSDSGIFWVTMENMSQHYITFSHQRVSDLAASQSGSKILPKGAVIASCVGNFGVAAINKVDVIINQQLQAFQPVNVIADYLLVIVSISKNYFELIGTAATLIYVNKEGFENLPVLVPPECEQISICKFINSNNEKFELLIDHSINQINLLLERRTALISAAVTGKIDVRDWVAPDTQDVEEPQEATA
ncbi:restriction endonuclease subunit S [Klebsiella sp. JB_Kp019]|uniref:restriction endonuclease subunit S n=1 Tax=unclassified Klebsiella TaxID=2608929 RepID=UPI0032B4A2D0